MIKSEVRVKPHVRVRRGRLEQVKSFLRGYREFPRSFKVGDKVEMKVPGVKSKTGVVSIIHKRKNTSGEPFVYGYTVKFDDGSTQFFQRIWKQKLDLSSQVDRVEKLIQEQLPKDVTVKFFKDEMSVPEFRFFYKNNTVPVGKVLVLGISPQQDFQQLKETIKSIKDRVKEIDVYKDVVGKYLKTFDPSKLPEGFEVTENMALVHGMENPTQPYYSRESQYLVVNGENVRIRVNFDLETRGTKPILEITGTTDWKDHEGQWRTFDRLGVSPSFSYQFPVYKDYFVEGKTLNQIINDEINRAAEHVEKFKDYIDIPTTGFSASSATIENYKQWLQEGSEVHLMPSGFGRGYVLRAKPTGAPYEHEGTMELARFFGLPRIWIESVEAD